MAAPLEDARIRTSTEQELAVYLCSTLKAHHAQVLSTYLLAGVAAESIPPRVFSVWLSVCHDPKILSDALWQQQSIFVRRIAIVRLGKRLRSPYLFEAAYSAVGGTEGILTFLAEASVDEVRLFCKTVRIASKSEQRKHRLQHQITQLLKSLFHEYFPDAPCRSTDTRPLLKYYCEMLPACTEEMVTAWLSRSDLPQPHGHRLVRAHKGLFWQLFREDIAAQREGQHSYLPLLRGVPPGPAGDSSISWNMSNFREALRCAVHNGVEILSWSNLNNSLAISLLKRLRRNRCDVEACRDVMRLLVQYMQAFPEYASRLSLASKGIVAEAVLLCSRRFEQLKNELANLLAVVPSRPEQQLDVIQRLLFIVRADRRPQLLHLLLSSLGRFRIDINNEEDLVKSNFTWPTSLLLILPREYARSLLGRLMRSRYNKDVFDCNAGDVFSLDRTIGEPTLLSMYLCRGEGQVLEQGREIVRSHKQKATVSREQSERALWARGACMSAIASGCLDLLYEVLVWARRFNKDPLTIKKLYSGRELLNNTSLDLLCGIPRRPSTSTTTLADVSSSVKKGNEICLLLLETACMCVKEPSFDQRDWEKVRRIFSGTVRARLQRINRLQQTLHLSDDAVFENIWQDTLSTCLALEELGHKDSHGRLMFNTVGGPFHKHFGIVSGKPAALEPSKATVRFLNELSQQRDKFWSGLRRRIHPDVATLPHLWPKSLPVQWLLPADLGSAVLGGGRSYLYNRAEEVVFVEPSAALAVVPDDEAVKTAIGPFVHDWKHALSVYVNGAPEGSERRQVTEKAWAHAIEKLTGTGLSPLEGFQYWRAIFAAANVSTDFIEGPAARPPYPTLPEIDGDESLYPTEWDPDPERRTVPALDRQRSTTVLDAMLCAYENPPSSTVLSPFISGHCWGLNRVYTGFWCSDTTTEDQVLPVAKEAFIASAALWLEATSCKSHTLLAAPFPNSLNGRFPAMYLADEFLECTHLQWEAAIGALHDLGSTPPALLLRLAREMLISHFEQSEAGLGSRTFAVLRLLTHSDKPALATDLVKGLILDRPDDSSWHRFILNKGFLGRLSKKDAAQLIQDLVVGMQVRLKDTVGQPTPGEDQSDELKRPKIKVTTVKMLAQLLDSSFFIDPKSAVETLAELLQSTRQIDVRVAITQGLLKTSGNATNESLGADITRGLEQNIVPIAGALNERRTLTEEQWQEAESSGDLPEVYTEGDKPMQGPVLQCLIGALALHPWSQPDQKRQLVDQILLPALRLSAANNRRWIGMFLRKHGYRHSDMLLPQIPTQPIVLSLLLRDNIQWLPTELFNLYSDHVLTNLGPSPALLAINEDVLRTRELHTSNAGAHWLSMWNIEPADVISFGGFHAQTILARPWTVPEVSNGIQPADIREHVCKVADALVRSSDGIEIWERFQSSLAPPLRKKVEWQSAWYGHCRPVIERIIQGIESMRTPQWQSDPDRKPSVLPDTFQMKLWLFTYPSTPWISGHEERMQKFADEVSGVIAEMAASQRSYHKRLQLLKNAVRGIHEATYAALAVRLGALTTAGLKEPTLKDLLRIEVAAHLLEASTKPKDGAEVLKAQMLLREWRSSVDEEVRMYGMSLLRRAGELEKLAWLKES